MIVYFYSCMDIHSTPMHIGTCTEVPVKGDIITFSDTYHYSVEQRRYDPEKNIWHVYMLKVVI